MVREAKATMIRPLHIRIFKSILLPLCLLAAGCTTSAPPQNQIADELILYNWAEYMPESVLEAFTAEYGVRVTYQTYGSMEEAVAQVRAGQVYDVAVLENNNIKPLAAEGLLAEINYQNVPNFKNVSPNFRDLAFDPDNRYSIPYDYGTTGLLVRSDLIDTPVTHWADLWDPRFAGKIAVRPLAYELIGISLKSLGFPLNSEDPEALEAALERLLELKPVLIFVDAETSKAIPSLVNGEAVIMVGWGNDALSARQENPAIGYILPEEGTLLWGESFAIPANSPHQYTAELFLNFLLRPEISAQIVNESRYATANQAAHPFIDSEIFKDPIVFPPTDVFKQADWYLPLSPVGEKLYAEIWERFMMARP
jgi:spermidine/putrescine transport system substrate-binding protein